MCWWMHPQGESKTWARITGYQECGLHSKVDKIRHLFEEIRKSITIVITSSTEAIHSHTCVQQFNMNYVHVSRLAPQFHCIDSQVGVLHTNHAAFSLAFSIL